MENYAGSYEVSPSYQSRELLTNCTKTALSKMKIFMNKLHKTQSACTLHGGDSKGVMAFKKICLILSFFTSLFSSEEIK